MTLLSADIIAKFYTFLWPMLRISALMLTAPLFAQAAFNVRLRVLLALVLTWLVFPLHDWPVLDPVSGPGLREVFNQIMIGALAGLILQVVVAAVVVAGQSVAASMGLSMASMIDPTMGSVPVVSQFLLLLASLVLVSAGGHVILLSLIIESFRTLPVGTSIINQDSLGLVLRWSSMIFLGGVLIALPVMIALLFVNVGVGIVSRAAPSLNIFSLGFPAAVIGGFLVLFIFLGSMVGRMEWLWVSAFDVVRDLLGVPRG